MAFGGHAVLAAAASLGNAALAYAPKQGGATLAMGPRVVGVHTLPGWPTQPERFNAITPSVVRVGCKAWQPKQPHHSITRASSTQGMV
eukprot:365475-Chlamydomonas_euryale.AAC.6